MGFAADFMKIMPQGEQIISLEYLSPLRRETTENGKIASLESV